MTQNLLRERQRRVENKSNDQRIVLGREELGSRSQQKREGGYLTYPSG